MRTCSGCNKAKPKHHFYKDRKTCSKCREKRKKFYDENWDKNRQWQKNWQAKNKDKERVRKKLVSYKRKCTVGHFTKLQIEEKFNYWNNACWICKATDKKLTIDHVKPLSKGGLNWVSNLRPCCSTCNSRKGGYWARRNVSVHEKVQLVLQRVRKKQRKKS